MATRGEELFDQLHTLAGVTRLIGQTEDVHLDCKEWPTKDDDAQRVFAKAARGLTNAEGGVLVVGVKAKPTAKDEPDLIDSVNPVADTSTVKSRILDLVGQLVEPGIEGKVDECKTRSSRRCIPIPPALGERLRQLCKGEWIFSASNGSALNPRNALRRHVLPAAKAVGLDGINWHSFRHSFVVNQRRSGTHAKVIAGLLGHAGTLLHEEVYDHYEVAEGREPIAKLLQTVMNSTRADSARPQVGATEGVGGPAGIRTPDQGIMSPLL